MSPGRALALVTLPLLILAGCAPQPLLPVDSWEEHLARVAALETWYVSGQLGVRLPDNSGSARLRWQQTQDDFRIDLSGPFGQGRTLIQGRPGAVTLQQGGEEPLQASSAEELLWLATEWQVPVEELRYWVRGIPSPEQPIQQLKRNREGLLAELQQGGWHLQYSNYTLVDNHWHLPRRIVAQHEGARLTLVIHTWSAS